MNFLGRARPADEQHDLENLAALLHGQNLGHPGANPFEVLRSLDHPDHDDLASSNCPVAITSDEITDVGNGLGHTNTTGKEHDCSVRVKLMRAAIGTLDKTTGNKLSVGVGGRAAVECTSEAGAATDDERNRRLLLIQDIVAVHRETLFTVELLSFVAPGYGERVRLPETDRWHVKVGVLSGPEIPRAGHADSHAAGTARESLNESLGPTGSDVAISDTKETGSSVKDPQGTNGVEILELWELLEVEVVPETKNRQDGEGDMGNLEGLIVGVSENAGCLNAKGNHGTGRLQNFVSHVPRYIRSKITYNESPHQKLDGDGSVESSAPAILGSIANQPGHCVGNRLQHDNTPKPAVKKIEGVERDAEKIDERVVAASHEEQRDHVDNSEVSGPVSNECRNLTKRAGEVDGHDAKGNVGAKVGQEEKKLKTGRKSADIEGRADLELAVVPLAKDGCVEDVLLEP